MNISKVGRILIMPAAGLGDMVMAAPVIRSLRVRFPDAHLAVLAHYTRGADELGQCMPYLDEVIDFPLKRYSWPCVIRFFLGSYWPMFRSLKKKRFDTAIILAANPIRTILMKMLRPNKVFEVKGMGHPTRLGLELVGELGCSTEPLDFGFEVPEIDLEKTLPSSLPRPWIGIHPFSAMCWRQWNHFEQFIDRLKCHKGTIILLGKSYNHNFISGILDLVNKLSVLELTCVINSLDILVSCDSGPMHIGFAVNTPTIALFGPVKPGLRVPLTNIVKHTILYIPTIESEKVRRIAERKNFNISNIQQISAEAVFEAVKASMAKGKNDFSKNN